MPPEPTRSLGPRRSFRKSVSIYPRSEPVINLFCGEKGTFSFLEKKMIMFISTKRGKWNREEFFGRFPGYVNLSKVIFRGCD